MAVDPLKAPRNASTLSRYDGAAKLASDGLAELVELGAAACGVERCMVALLDERRQRFEAIVGLPSAEALRFVPLWLYALHANGTVAVSDVLADDALAATGGLGARAFLAVPLRLSAGEVLGVLCLADRAPRVFSERDLRIVAALGRQAEKHLALQGTIAGIRDRHLHHLDALATLRGLLRAATIVAIFAADRTGKITLFNAGAERVFGLSGEAVVGQRRVTALLDAEQLAERSAELSTELGRPVQGFEALVARCSGGAPDERAWSLRRDGKTQHISMVVAPVSDEDRQLIGYVFIAKDETERWLMARMKDDLVAIVSHELRTPLTALLGALDLVAGGVAGPLTGSLAELFGIARDNGHRLLHLVNDILDVQKLESGLFELVRARCDLRDVAARAVDLTRPVGVRRGVSIAISDDGRGVVVLADFDRLVQVLVNLLANAIKASPESDVVVVSIGAEPGIARISVTDYGEGIPEAFRERVFSRFTQATGHREGTGLGLTIVKSLVELHGGRVHFESVPGAGATFHVELPAVSAE